MPDTPQALHVVLGANGSAGHSIAIALNDEGLDTRAVSRSGSPDLPDGIETARADITKRDELDRVVKGASVVYMAAQPAYHRWAEEFPSMLEGVIESCTEAGAKLVMVDNLYAYGPGHDRLTPNTPHAATDTKGLVRQGMHERLMQAHASQKLKVAIGQASDYYGPRADNSGITAVAFSPISGKGSLRWFGSLNALHSVAYLPDIARAYVTLGTSDKANGRAWVLPHGKPLTGAEFLDLVNEQLPSQRKTSALSMAMLRVAALFHKPSKELLGVAYQWNQPWIADDTSYQATFGPFLSTPIKEAVANTVTWYSEPR